MRNIIIIYLLVTILLCVRAAQPIQDSAISDYPDESDEDFGEENILSEIFKVIINLSKF